MKLLGNGQRAVAADANQPLDAKLLDGRRDALEKLGIEIDPVLHADRCGKAALVRRTENRAALGEDARRVLGSERDIAHRVVQPFVSLEKADALVAQLPRSLRHGADNGV